MKYEDRELHVDSEGMGRAILLWLLTYDLEGSQNKEKIWHMKKVQTKRKTRRQVRAPNKVSTAQPISGSSYVSQSNSVLFELVCLIYSWKHYREFIYNSGLAFSCADSVLVFEHRKPRSIICPLVERKASHRGALSAPFYLQVPGVTLPLTGVSRSSYVTGVEAFERKGPKRGLAEDVIFNVPLRDSYSSWTNWTKYNSGNYFSRSASQVIDLRRKISESYFRR